MKGLGEPLRKRIPILTVALAVVLAISVLVMPSAAAYSLLGVEWDSVDPVECWYNYYDYEMDPTGMSCWWYSAQDWNATQTDVNYEWVGDTDPYKVRCGLTYNDNAPWDGKYEWGGFR
jgi:hypothetical protein